MAESTFPTGRHGNLVFRTLTGADPDMRCMAWFLCPGCDEAHAFYLPRWSFDGNLDAPTMSPSLLCRTPSSVCHLFLRRGRLMFLSDCTHALAGQTVEIPEPPAWLTDEGGARG